MHNVPCRLGRDQSQHALPSRIFAKVLARLKGTSRMLVLATLFANALVNFDFERRLDGRPAHLWMACGGLEPARLRTNSLSP
jgi:hypothetical protein